MRRLATYRSSRRIPEARDDEGRLKLSDELITRAQQTAARIRFIEDASAAGRCRWRGRITEVPHMSRQNKVNPGMYTQRGRLTQDDAARELRKQSAIGSPHTWQPVQRDKMPAMIAEPEQDEVEDDEQADKPAKRVEKTSARVKADPASSPRKPAKTAAKKAGAKKSATGKTAAAKNATTAAKRGNARTTKPTRAAKAKSAKRRKKLTLSFGGAR